MTERRPEFLTAGETCWKTVDAERAAVLIDGAAYYAALRSAILQAERSIFIVGWDIDSRVRLTTRDGDADADDAPEDLRGLLQYVADRRPEIEIHLLLWDYSVLFALEREPLPAVNLVWNTPEQVQVCLDDVLPLGASHHQKIVIVDDTVAFCGGLDLTIRRWDTPEHKPSHSQRVDPSGAPYGPFHDIQMIVDGAAAQALGDLVRDRWFKAACEKPLPYGPANDCWPGWLDPDFRNVIIGAARTIPEIDDESAVREVEALYIRAIERAERFIYIENQYVTADTVADALVRRLRENDRLEVVIVTADQPGGWLESRSMVAGRRRFHQKLKEAVGKDGRIAIYSPVVAADGRKCSIMVHSKLMIVDDVFLRVGSSNLNNRSMGLDTECDLAIEAATNEQEKTIAGIRHRLLAEHLGIQPEDVSAVFRGDLRIIPQLEKVASDDRRLQPVSDAPQNDDTLSQALRNFADPERPIEADGFIGDMFGGEEKLHRARSILGVVAAAVLLIGIALIWRYSPVGDLIGGDNLGELIDTVSDSGWGPLLLPLIYVALTLVVFPITILIALTAAVFGPWAGFAYALTGSLSGAAATYLVGAYFGKRLLRNLMGRRLNAISRRLAEKGVWSVATLRMVPVAPFTFINLGAGASHIRFQDYMFGTALGMTPGILVMTFLGDRLASLWREPSTTNVVIFCLVVITWVVLSWSVQNLVAWLRKKRNA